MFVFVLAPINMYLVFFFIFVLRSNIDRNGMRFPLVADVVKPYIAMYISTLHSFGYKTLILKNKNMFTIILKIKPYK